MRAYFGFLAVVFLAGAAWLFLRRVRVAWRGVPAMGQVVGFEERRGDGNVHYLPVVAFRDRRGLPHRFTSVAGGASPQPPVGSVVHVRYLPDAPEQVFLVSFLHLWAAPFAMLVLGLGALLAWMKA